jgi:hypothetical protein
MQIAVFIRPGVNLSGKEVRTKYARQKNAHDDG